MRLNKLIKRIEKVQENLIPLVKEACERKSTEKWIVNANRQQLSQGINTNGVLMNDGVYSPSTIRQRLRRNLPVDHVYLSFIGDMQQGMKVEYSDTGFSVATTDWKQALVDEVMSTGYWPTSVNSSPEYGPVFGLTTEHKRQLAKLIEPIVVKKIRKLIFRN